jgi:hypothetical protein
MLPIGMRGVFLCLCFLYLSVAYSKGIKVTTVSSLNFGVGAPGDSSKVVVAGTTESASNGSFTVTGDPNTAYTIILPTKATMQIKNSNSPDSSIEISGFNSYPVAGANGLLGSFGSQSLYLGATRAGLRSSQRAGSYSGSFSLTVVY